MKISYLKSESRKRLLQFLRNLLRIKNRAIGYPGADWIKKQNLLKIYIY